MNKDFDYIKIEGANVNNLKNINLEIEKHKFNVVTGVSGSGKSSLVFDCIYAMAQSSFYEMLSTYVVKNLPKISKPNVLNIQNLSPCVLIDQKKLGTNPRSTVGTSTEIYTYLRLLFSRLGQPSYDSSYFSFNTAKGCCKKCNGLGVELVIDIDKLLDMNLSLNEGAIKHRTWKVGSRYFNIQKSTGLFDMDKKLRNYTDVELNNLLYMKPTNFLNKNSGFVQNWTYEGVVHRLLKRQSDSRGLQINDYDKLFFKESQCSCCDGARLSSESLKVQVCGKNLKDLLSLELTELFEFINTINSSKVSEIIFKIKKDLKSLIDLGLGYLTLNRGIATLSNGESQKVKLAKSLNNSLNELIYILDEPSIGFHSRDVNKIVNSIRNIVSNNNTAIVVEHNREIINRSDNIIDIGPKSGENGGEIVFAGKREDILNCSNSITGHYLNNKKRILSYHKPIDAFYHVKNININNIHNLDVKIPLNMLICITGVSGSGKSSLLKYLIDNDKSIIKIGKENISTSSRSNVATYTNIFDFIRVLFAKSNSVDAGQFSFNSVGACSNCGGAGHVKYDMHFLGDVIQVCEVCNGKRYNQLVLNYKFKGKNIAEVLEMTIDEAITFFDDDEIISRLLILKEVGLEYLKLGQTLDTLSGGEIQRINLAKNLVKKGNIYVFDEPTQGLHLKDIEKILDIIKNIVNKGNTVICIEHNLDFILSCDYIVDMGPDAGKNGGKVVFQGYVDEILNCNSFTAQAIKNYLSE